MSGDRCFKADLRRVVHETIDGETILIDLDTGVYYSLSGSGPEIWDRLMKGYSQDEVIAEMRRRGVPPNGAAEATLELIGSLEAEELIEESEPRTPPAAAETDASVARFERPVLQRYTDMAYFLMLDPLHEVQDAGWPHEQTRPLEP